MSGRAGEPRGEGRFRGHPIFAALYDLMLRGAEADIDPWRRRVTAGAAGVVLELGVGTGLNLPHYDWDRIQRYYALEPDPHMMRRARARADGLGLGVTWLEAAAEAIPLPGDSVDVVTATHVLCSVRDPERVLAEVHRVLKPGGAFRFFEHVRAGDPRSARWQDLITPLWRRLGAGCHPNRDTVAVISRHLHLEEHVAFNLGFGPVKPQHFGVARKPCA
ncbi:MAG TPA: class I SAM-dependent methyltransferase [Bacillota bacterium]